MKSKIPKLSYRGQDTRIVSGKCSIGNAELKEQPEYTGTEMLGISIIHKSCLQPIFSKEAAVDAANMRR